MAVHREIPTTRDRIYCHYWARCCVLTSRAQPTVTLFRPAIRSLETRIIGQKFGHWVCAIHGDFPSTASPVTSISGTLGRIRGRRLTSNRPPVRAERITDGE